MDTKEVLEFIFEKGADYERLGKHHKEMCIRLDKRNDELQAHNTMLTLLINEQDVKKTKKKGKKK